MTFSFPAIIKSLEITDSGMQAVLDISPPDISLLADLVDQEVRIAIALPIPPSDSPTPEEKLPFDPDDRPDHTPAALKKPAKKRG
ncbi:MAG: hypothetical protein AAB229_03660 [Candidatus Hydrogenedentota bacterium]